MSMETEFADTTVIDADGVIQDDVVRQAVPHLGAMATYQTPSMTSMSSGLPPLAMTDQTPKRPDIAGHEWMTWEQCARCAEVIGKSGLAPPNVKTNQAIMLILITGRELGISMMQALQNIHIIPTGGGLKPSLSAQLMHALVMRSGLANTFEIVENTGERCVLYVQRRGQAKTSIITWTIEDAKRAGLIKPNGNWEKYPKAMLRARCVSEAARTHFADVINGMYSPDELADEEASALRQARASSSASGSNALLDKVRVTASQLAQPAPSQIVDVGLDDLNGSIKDDARLDVPSSSSVVDAPAETGVNPATPSKATPGNGKITGAEKNSAHDADESSHRAAIVQDQPPLDTPSDAAIVEDAIRTVDELRSKVVEAVGAERTQWLFRDIKVTKKDSAVSAKRKAEQAVTRLREAQEEAKARK